MIAKRKEDRPINISEQYAQELGRQVDELEKENADLRAELALKTNECEALEISHADLAHRLANAGRALETIAKYHGDDVDSACAKIAGAALNANIRTSR